MLLWKSCNENFLCMYALLVIILASVVLEKVGDTVHMKGVTPVCNPNGTYAVYLYKKSNSLCIGKRSIYLL